MHFRLANQNCEALIISRFVVITLACNVKMAAGESVSNPGQLLQRISNTSKEGEKLLKKVGTAQDTCQVRDQLKENIGRLTTDIKDVKNQIDRLGRSSEQGDKVQHNKLIKDFKAVFAKADVVLKSYEEKEARYPSQHLFEKEMSLRREERTASLRAGQTLEQQQDLDMEDAVALEQRNQELARLHEDIQGLNQIQQDIAVAVGDQQEQIDAIEDNLESAGANVADGTRALGKGAMWAKKNRKLTAIIVAVVIGIIVGVIVLIVILGVAIGCSTPPGNCISR